MVLYFKFRFLVESIFYSPFKCVLTLVMKSTNDSSMKFWCFSAYGFFNFRILNDNSSIYQLIFLKKVFLYFILSPYVTIYSRSSFFLDLNCDNNRNLLIHLNITWLLNWMLISTISFVFNFLIYFLIFPIFCVSRMYIQYIFSFWFANLIFSWPNLTVLYRYFDYTKFLYLFLSQF